MRIVTIDSVKEITTNVIGSLNLSIDEKIGKTKWTYLEIPFMVWHRFEKSKLVVDAGVGATLGMLQKVNSHYLNPELTNLENISTSANYRKIVYSAVFATRFHYRLNNNLMVGIDLKYKQNASSIFKDTYPVDQRFKSFNAGISIQYQLNY